MRFCVDSFLWRQEVQLELDRLGLSWDYDLFCLDSNNPEHQYAIEVLGRFVKDSLIELLRDTYCSKSRLLELVDSFREPLMTAHGFIVNYPDSLHYDRIVLLREKVIKGLSRRGVRFNFDDEYRDGEGIRLKKELHELIDLCNNNAICENDFNAIRALIDEVCEFTECYSDSSHCGKLVSLREDAITVLSKYGVAFDSDGEYVVGSEIEFSSFGKQSRGKYNDAQRIEEPLIRFALGCNGGVYEAESTLGNERIDYADNRPDEIVDKVLIKEHVREIVDLLPKKQRDTIKFKYGLYPTSCGGQKTNSILNISRQGMHERELKALKMLRLLATVEDAEWVGVSAKRRAKYLQEREEGLSQLCVETAARNERLLLRRKLESIANTLGVPLEQILARHKQGIPIDKMSRAYTPAPAPTIQRLILLRNKWVLSVNELLGIIGCDEHSLAEAMDRNGLYVKWTRQNTIKGLKILIGNVNDMDFEKAVSKIGVTKEEYLAGYDDPTDAYLDCLVWDEKRKRRTRVRMLVERLGVGKDELRMMMPRNSNDAKPSNEVIASAIAKRIYDWVADPLDLKWLPMSKKQE